MRVIKVSELIVEAKLTDEGVWLDHHLTKVVVYASVAAVYRVVRMLYRPKKQGVLHSLGIFASDEKCCRNVW